MLLFFFFQKTSADTNKRTILWVLYGYYHRELIVGTLFYLNLSAALFYGGPGCPQPGMVK